MGEISHDISPAIAFEMERILPSLERRRRDGSLRQLKVFHTEGAFDFSSNDYPQLSSQADMVATAFSKQPAYMPRLGSTGSRLLTGNLDYSQNLEKQIAKWHNRPAALLVNSGYDANLSVLSTLTMNSTVIMDELCHNSLLMGVRLSRNCTVRKFHHNSIEHLERVLMERSLEDLQRPSLIVIETVYSMDGDRAPVNEIFRIALQYKACVIVDEAHGLGMFGENGMGVLAELHLENHPSLLCSIYTFGKAAGCHGAAICGSKAVIDYLCNYGRPIVYSTAIGLHSLVTIGCSYKSMRSAKGKSLRAKVQNLVSLFRSLMKGVMCQAKRMVVLVDSVSPIQALIIPGNEFCSDFCQRILKKSSHKILLFPIRSPTVPKGLERVRIIIHAHNSRDEIRLLVGLILSTLEEMSLLADSELASARILSRL